MPRSHRTRRAVALVIASLLAAGGLTAVTPLAATAEGIASAPADANPPGSDTEATIVDMIDRSGLYGGTVPSATAMTPYPTSGLVDQRSVETAQIVLDDPGTPTPDDILTYCIDLATQTTIGIHYELGTWTDANVPNLPYVQWILDNYYPTVPALPAGTAAEKVRAVQGAIWYFTDQFVVSTFYPTERSAVRTIVQAAQAAIGGGPTPPAPPLPTLEILPASLEGVVDDTLVGPYTVAGDVASATIEIQDTLVYRDAAGTIPVVDGDPVAPGDELWALYDAQETGQGFTLTAYATVEAGNVYLYDGGNPPLQSAQKLVLAAPTQVPIRAAASIVHPDVATLQVDVVVAGAAAGQQGQVELTVTCTSSLLPSPITYTRYVPSGSPAATYSFSFPDVPYLPSPDGTVCDVVQAADGSNAMVQASATIVPPQVTLDAPGTQTITVTDTYTLIPGDFQVDIEVTGAAAGLQDTIVLLASCDTGGGTVTQSFNVPAGTTGLSTAGTISGLPNGAVCSASVTTTGDDPDAELVSSVITPAFVTVPAAGTAVTTVVNEYDAPAPTTGRFAVDVTVAGAAAGLQDAISVLASCDSGGSTPFSLPAGAGAGTYRVGTVASVPVGAICTVAQTADGGNADADLTDTTIVPASVTISDTVLEVITVTDTYAAPLPPAGSLRVDVTIAGAAAGAQAGITVTAQCGTAPDVVVATFSLAAGAAAGTHVAGTIPEVPVGFACAVTLDTDGADADAVLTGSTITPASVVIADGVESTITVANTYAAPAPGPTPSPVPPPMPVTGDASGPWRWIALALLVAGAVIAGSVALVRRAKGSTPGARS